MVAKFNVLGSCDSRDIFYSGINKDYKKYFFIGEDGIRISFIRLMQNPIEYDEQDLDLHLDVHGNIYKLKSIKKDLDRSFLNILRKNEFGYLIIDTCYDTNFGVLEFKDTNGQKNYITNNPGLTETSFYNKLVYKRFLTMHSDANNYFNLWKKNCNLFFDFINQNFPDLQIILNPVRDVYNVLTADGNIVESDSFKRTAFSNNKVRNLFDKYICSNFDVDVLHFNSNTLMMKIMWGFNKVLLNFDLEYQKYDD